MLALTGTLVAWIGQEIARALYYAIPGAGALALAYITLRKFGPFAALVFTVLVACLTQAVVQLGIEHVVSMVLMGIKYAFTLINAIGSISTALIMGCWYALICPFQCIFGALSAIATTSKYWVAIVTFDDTPLSPDGSSLLWR